MPRDRRSAPETDAFLAAIDSRLAALQRLRDSYLAARAVGAIGPHGEASWLPALGAVPPATPSEAPEPAPAPSRRRSASIVGAAEAYLAASPVPRKAREVAEGLRAQGLASSSSNLTSTITSALHRLERRGRVVRRPEGWAVHGSPAARLAASAPAPAPPAPRKQKQKRTRRPRPLAQSKEPTPDREEGGLAWRIESLLKSHGHPVAARYVANATGEPLNVVGLTLGRMIQQDRVEKDEDGRFAVVVRSADGPTSGESTPGTETSRPAPWPPQSG